MSFVLKPQKLFSVCWDAHPQRLFFFLLPVSLVSCIITCLPLKGKKKKRFVKIQWFSRGLNTPSTHTRGTASLLQKATVIFEIGLLHQFIHSPVQAPLTNLSIICLPVHLYWSILPFTNSFISSPSIHPFIYLYNCPFIPLSIHPCLHYLPINPSFYSSVYPASQPLIYIHLYLSFCLSTPT